MQDEYDRLKDILKSSFFDLAELLSEVEEENICGAGKIYAPQEWKSFFRFVGAESSVCCTISPQGHVAKLIRACVSGEIRKDPVSLIHLKENVPLIYQLLTSVDHFPPSFSKVMDCLIERAEAPFLGPAAREEPPEDEDADDWRVYFPQLATKRKRGLFRADVKNQRAKKCRKRTGKGHPILGPGTFTLFCLHGNCHSFTNTNLSRGPGALTFCLVCC